MAGLMEVVDHHHQRVPAGQHLQEPAHRPDRVLRGHWRRLQRDQPSQPVGHLLAVGDQLGELGQLDLGLLGSIGGLDLGVRRMISATGQ